MTPQEIRDRHHGHPYEIVIPCLTLDEANAEKADLHVAAEARAFICRAGVTLTPEEAASAAACVRAASRVAYMRDDLDALAARLEAAS